MHLSSLVLSLISYELSETTPLHKSGSSADPTKYRQISILSPFRKVLGKLVYNQLYSFLEKKEILFKYQIAGKRFPCGKSSKLKNAEKDLCLWCH